MRQVAVLFARADSIYKTMPGCDVWDMDRDARKFPGGMPIVGHPPCRAWGQLRHLAVVKPRADEKALAPWCIQKIRENGGVLEHPKGSSLWPVLGLPEPNGLPDEWGGMDARSQPVSLGAPRGQADPFLHRWMQPRKYPARSTPRRQSNTHSIGRGVKGAARPKLGGATRMHKGAAGTHAPRPSRVAGRAGEADPQARQQGEQPWLG